MSEYPKALQLHGKTSLLGPSGSTWYRIDSAEDEKLIREQHAKKVEEAKRQLETLLHAKKATR